MNIKTTARVGLVVASALVAVACATPDVAAPVTPVVPPAEGGVEATAPAGNVEQTMNISAVEGITTTNVLLPWGNSSHNQNIMYLTNGPGFAFFDENLNHVRNTDFGTFSPLDTAFNDDGTLTVTYTVNEGVLWSDGTPVDAADLVLFWAANNNRFDTITEEAYADQLAEGEDYVTLPDGQVYFPSGSTGMTDVGAFPIISDDGRSVTFTFGNPRADWFFQFGVSPVPAHVLGRLALGIDDPMEAKQAIITAFGGPENYRAQDGTEVPTVQTTLGRITDPAGSGASVPGTLTTFVEPNVHELGQIAEVFSTAFEITGGLPNDPSLFLSRGPFVMAEIQDGQFIRLERNPHFTAYGNVVSRPALDEITVRIIPNAMAQAQALQNVEVDFIDPTADQDILHTLQGMPGVEYAAVDTAVYEHLTMIMDNLGPFDPAYWAERGVANPEEAARAVRVAFLQTVPREQIIDLIIDPVAPGSTTRDSWLIIPGAPGYDQLTANAGIDLFNEDAAATLHDAGLDEFLPIDVRVLYAVQNPRRAQQFQLIQAAGQADGLFRVIDEGDETWGVRLRQNTGSFDVALFGWQGTSTAFLNAEANTITGGFNNIGGFSNARVDELWAEARTTTDPARIQAIATEMESILNHEGFGVPIFQHPGLIAWRDDVQNASSISLAPTIHWNFWDWQRAAEN